MSEKLLKALMQLFAIVAKQEGVSTKERNIIELFLLQQLNREAVEDYLKLFDSFAAVEPDKAGKEGEGKKHRMASVKESARILRICTQINKELTQKQKIIVIFRLFELVNADKSISEQEHEFATTVAETFNISKDEFNSIKKFVTTEDVYHLDIQEVLTIDNNEKSSFGKGKHIHSEFLNGQLAILRIPSEEMYMIRYRGDMDVYLNGVILTTERVNTFANGSVVRISRGGSIYYSDIVSKFLSDEAATRISFEAKNIQFQFPNGRIGLRDVSVVEESGRLIGFMGGSGAGKTTLLSVLNGNEVPSGGEVLINGINIHRDKEKIKGIIGYIPQDDLLIEDLTVYQNLFYAAKLCFKSFSQEQIDKLVIKTLLNLGLLEAKDLKVGSPLEKIISGGQRKRLNIGLELLREPSVLFVDEPTSGLSSRDSENIMDLLKELSLRGKLIFVVIHQPSSEIYKMFDKLLILDVGGYPIYYGNPVEAVIYFKRQANQINSEQGECIICGNVNPEQIFNIIETKVVDEYGRFTNLRKISPQYWNEKYKENIKISTVKTCADKPPSTLSIPSALKQLKVFIIRDVLSKISNKQYLIINLTEAPLLAIILAFIVRYYNVDEANVTGYLFSQNENMPAYIFMSIIVSLFMGLTVSAEEIIRDRKILKRETFLNLSRISYLVSKMVILFSLSAIQTLMFVIIGNWIVGIRDMNMIYWLVLFTTSCFANMLGLNISATFNSAVTIYILIPILLIPQLILSGVIIKFDKLNPLIASVDKVPIAGDIMTSRWAFESLVVSQYKDNQFQKQFYDLEKEMGIADYKKVYYIDRLKSKVDFCITNMNDKNKDIQEQVIKSFSLLQYELSKEMKDIELVKFDYLQDMEVSKFNKTIADSCKDYLNNLKHYYIKKYKYYNTAKDELIADLESTSQKKQLFIEKREKYHNEEIEKLVKNASESNRIIEKDGRLIQKINSIFLDPDNYSNMFDFRAHFFAPRKYFLGKYFDTLYLNVTVIWLMCIILYVTLYYEVLGKILSIGEIISERFRKKV